MTPLPAVWHDGALHLRRRQEQKGVNLARDARCALTTGNNAWKAVWTSSSRERHFVVDDDRLVQLAEAWSTKYAGDWQVRGRQPRLPGRRR